MSLSTAASTPDTSRHPTRLYCFVHALFIGMGNIQSSICTFYVFLHSIDSCVSQSFARPLDFRSFILGFSTGLAFNIFVFIAVMYKTSSASTIHSYIMSTLWSPGDRAQVQPKKLKRLSLVDKMNAPESSKDSPSSLLETLLSSPFVALMIVANYALVPLACFCLAIERALSPLDMDRLFLVESDFLEGKALHAP